MDGGGGVKRWGLWVDEGVLADRVCISWLLSDFPGMLKRLGFCWEGFAAPVGVERKGRGRG
jgi:hypothetical protein